MDELRSLNWPQVVMFFPTTLLTRAPSKDVLSGYLTRVTFLQRAVSELIPPADPVARLGVDLSELGLSKDTPVLIGGVNGRNNTAKKSSIPATPSSSQDLPKVKPFRPLPRAVGHDQVKGKQIQQRHSQRHQMDEREQLLGQNDQGERNKHAVNAAAHF